jgi:hypothetical protein
VKVLAVHAHHGQREGDPGRGLPHQHGNTNINTLIHITNVQIMWIRSIAEWLEHLAVNAKVATVQSPYL